MGPARQSVGGVVLLLVRGLLLWLVVPLGVLVWPLVALSFRRRKLGLGEFLGWLDLNLTSAIQRSVVRPFFDAPIPWTPFGEAVGLTHRIRLLDPV